MVGAQDGAFVCVLIDEVESLTAARQSALAGNEPSDALRVVNALLTQLDQLKRSVINQPTTTTNNNNYNNALITQLDQLKRSLMN